MRAGPIWNNRIPFAIVFLSVSLFLNPTMGTSAYRLPVYIYCGMRARLQTHMVARGQCGARESGRGRSGRDVERRDLRPRSAVHLWQSSHYAFRPSARFTRDYAARTHIFSPARIMLLFRLSWKASIGVEEMRKRFRGCPLTRTDASVL